MLQAIVFDFDGVIADTEPLHLRATQEVLRADGIELSERDYYERYLGFDDAGIMRAIAADRGLTIDEPHVTAFIARKSAVWESVVDHTSVLFPGAAECIRRCAAQVPLAIASGALGHEIDQILKSAGLREYFSAIVSATDSPRGKPAPDPYVKAIDRLRQAVGAAHEPRRATIAAGRCIAIEDSHWGIDSAHAAGLLCVALTTSYHADRLHSADLIVPSLEQITIPRLQQLISEVRG